MESPLPSIFEYVRSLRHTEEYRKFDVDPDAPFPKEAQYAYFVLATTTDTELFRYWASQTIYSPADFLRPAAASNPIATPEQLDAILDLPNVGRYTLEVIAQHRNTDSTTIDRILATLDPGNPHQWPIHTAIAGRANITQAQAALLLRYGLPMVNSALAKNPHVPQETRILAGLAA